jgi:hypothetical protein
VKTTEVETEGAYNFAKAPECLSLVLSASKRAKWLKGKEVYLGETNSGIRIMIPVTTITKMRIPIKYRRNGLPPAIFFKSEEIKKDIIYLMDVVTGSLYDLESKRCMSSETLMLLSYKIDPNHAKTLLTLKVAGLK